MKKSIIKQIYSETNELIDIYDLKKFRITQLKEWIFQKNILDFDDMSNLSKTLRETLNKDFYILNMKINTILEEEKTGTIKIILETHDKYLIEMVLLNDKNRYTLCISSQIGCPVGCKFCATGNIGYKRNLDVDEILMQFLISEKILSKKDSKLSNLVFMGMGEPLLNYGNVIKSIGILHDENGRNFSNRRITISTVGITKGIERLIKDNIRVKLFFSLHAGNQKTREKIIPKTNEFNKLINVLENYKNHFNKRVSIEYTMIKNINDSDNDLKNLIQIAKKLGNFVNLIEYNPIENLDFKPSARSHIRFFKSQLEKNNIEVAIRFRRGQDIKGACGQLVWDKLD